MQWSTCNAINLKQGLYPEHICTSETNYRKVQRGVDNHKKHTSTNTFGKKNCIPNWSTISYLNYVDTLQYFLINLLKLDMRQCGLKDCRGRMDEVNLTLKLRVTFPLKQVCSPFFVRKRLAVILRCFGHAYLECCYIQRYEQRSYIDASLVCIYILWDPSLEFTVQSQQPPMKNTGLRKFL